MRRCFLLSFLCVTVSVLLGAAARLPRDRAAEAAAPGPVPERRTLSLLRDGEPVRMPLEEYLVGAVAGEMPASFHPQALRAQAVASRTYALRREREPSPAHPGAAVCPEAGCCQVWLSEAERRERWGERFDEYESAVRAAVDDTSGMILTWGGEPILACFHASSPGTTESSGAVWAASLPYLVSVDTPEGTGDVPNFVTSVSLSPEELRQGVLTLAPEAVFDGAPESWVGERVLDEGGRVAFIRIGGASLPGTAVRKAFSLRSACFSLQWTGEEYLFTVEGSGHGVGMSQYGAQAMARQGADWQEILAHYYPGSSLEALSD